MAGGGVDRISALSDDLIQRILHFAPAREAASTGVLSTRWRSLWRSTGAVNLAVRVTGFSSCRDAFLRSAQATLRCRRRLRRVTRLTLRMEASRVDKIRAFLTREGRGASESSKKVSDVVDIVVSHRAARRLEELRIAAVVVKDSCGGAGSGGVSFDGGDRDVEGHVTVFKLGLYSAQSETLRVLDLTGCRDLRASALPRLTTLRLRVYTVELEDLQRAIDSAPELATVHLERVLFEGTDDDSAHLRCPAATALALVNCMCMGYGSGDDRNVGLEIDAPRLRSFKYAGKALPFSLTSPAPDMARADLHFVGAHREDFWRFLHNFRDVKALKLKVTYLNHIAVAGKATLAKRLPLHGVEHLELAGLHVPPASETAVGLAIANLLRCCPAVRDLVLRLTTVANYSTKNGSYGRALLQRQQQTDLDESLDRFARRRRKRKPPLMNSTTDEHLDQVGDILGLSGRSFACLKNSLRRVGIQFRLDQPNCIGVRLIKFFAENATRLEEMRIDDGNDRVCDHINHEVKRWIIASSSAKATDEKSWQPLRFRILPLERRT